MTTRGTHEFAEFHDGTRELLPEGASLDAAAAAAKEQGQFVWVCLDDPETAELEALAKELGLHPLALADAVSGKQQPKMQYYDEHLFVVLWTLRGPNGSPNIELGQLFLFVRSDLLLVVRRNADDTDLSAVVEDALTRLGPTSLDALYAVMSFVFAGYTTQTDHIEQKLQELETQVFDHRFQESIEPIYRLRQQIGRLQRAISGLAASLTVSMDHLKDMSVGDEKLEPYLRDLLDDLAGTNQFISDQDRALDGVLASHENNVAIRQNDDTRKISAAAAMLSVPTVLAGLYGMNFDNLPGVSSSFGWPVLLGAIVTIDAVLYVMFKRRRWL